MFFLMTLNSKIEKKMVAFPRTGPTVLYSLVKCDVEKPNFEWGKAAEERFMEAARCS